MRKRPQRRTQKNAHIVLAGCGNMGGALLAGWLAGKLTAHFTVIEPGPLPRKLQAKSVRHVRAVERTARPADVVVLAVKPQIMADTLAALNPCIGPRTLVLSIAAGISRAWLRKHTRARQPVVRAMPNLPASIGKGITVAVESPNVTAAQKTHAGLLLSCVGRVAWVRDEALMHAVTAVSGSGPAYLFYLAEILTAAGKKLGLPSALAATLARETLSGSAALMNEASAAEPGELRARVTSKGGTTEAALNILMDGTWQKTFDKALRAAEKRSRALGK